MDSLIPPPPGEGLLPEGMQALLAQIAANCSNVDEEYTLLCMLGIFDDEEE